MVITEDEYKDVLKLLIKCNIDLNQGINFALNSDYSPACNNFKEVLSSLTSIIDKIED